MDEEAYRLQELVNEVGGFPINRISHHNTDWQFVKNYLHEMRGPTDNDYMFNLRDTWRLNGMNCEKYDTSLKPHTLLMTGVSAEALNRILNEGMVQLAPITALFGHDGYYFTDCSSKAANQGCPDAWKYERHADQGYVKPTKDSVGYILFSDVALGMSNVTEMRIKSGVMSRGHNSLIFRGLYSACGFERVRLEDGYELNIPRGGFQRERHVEKISNKSNDFVYYDEFFVKHLKQVRPRILARVCYNFEAINRKVE